MFRVQYQRQTTNHQGKMTTMMTQRVVYPCFFLFVHFFLDVNSKPLLLQNGQPSQLKDKETRFPLFISTSPTKSHFGKHDSTSSGATKSHFGKQDSTRPGVKLSLPLSTFPTKSHFGKHDSTDETISDIFQRPLSSRAINDLSSNSERKCSHEPPRRRIRRYSLHGSKVMKLDIKWTIAIFSSKLPRSQQITILENAFKVWATHCRLSFMYTTDKSKADIIIEFVKGDHNDGQPFDGSGPLLAHAFYPQYGSSIHFDEEENWVADPNGQGGRSLLSVAIHEIGHSLGLRHSSVRTAVMSQMVRNGRNTLTADDIKAIQAKYGACTVQKLDAVMTSSLYKDKAYIFKNEWVWLVDLSTGKIQSGYPKKIADEFNKVLDGKPPFQSVFYEPEFDTVVFMFDKGYSILHNSFHPVRFPGVDVNMNYDVSHTYYTFLKQPPDAAFVDPTDPSVYHFFIGSNYYKYDMFTYQLFHGYPTTISSAWPGLPNNLDAAYYNYEENTHYFVKGHEYFKFDPASSTYYPAGVLSDLFPNLCPI